MVRLLTPNRPFTEARRTKQHLAIAANGEILRILDYPGRGRYRAPGDKRHGVVQDNPVGRLDDP